MSNLLDFQKRLQGMKREFAADLPAKAAAAREGWNAYLRGMDPEALAELHRAVHSLKGSSGTYGLDRVSAKAAALEDVLEALMEGRGRPSARELSDANRLLDALEAAAAAAAREARD
jgi:chemotaxis protein histidine kinase CheA